MKINLPGFAFKNLGRHKVKTVITAMAVMIGVSLYIFMDAWLLGAKIESQRNIINYEVGSAKIYTKAYFEKEDEKPMYENFGNWESIIKTLEDNGFDAAPRSTFGGSLIGKEGEIPVMITGVIPEIENKIFKYNKYIEKGGHFIENGKFEILLGALGAYNLKLKAGDSVKLSTVIDKKDESGKVKHINQVMDFKVAGIVNSPNPKTNGNVGYVPLDILQDEAGLLLEGKITEICIRKHGASFNSLPGKDESKQVIANDLKHVLPADLIVVDWKDEIKDFEAIMKSKSGGSKVFTLLLVIIAFIGIANAMLMAVIERTREIGMLRALGMTDSMILKAFVYEAGFIGLIGSLSGIFIGIIINIYMVNFGLDLSSYMKGFGSDYGFRVVGEFKAAWNWETIIFSGIIGTLLSALTAILPVKKALKMPVTDALRFE
jgi:ABC-type lipoprotein release transport system permease subunit